MPTIRGVNNICCFSNTSDNFKGILMTLTQQSPASSRVDPTTRLGHVHLVVNSLDRQIAFYTQVLGFTLHWREGSDAALGTASEVLLRLTEDPSARRYQQTTGMYHFAVLY